MMSSQTPELHNAPPRDIPRIFVGNLNLNITDSSLRTLLSRFGSIDNFSRSSCATFAHVSLKADEAALTKCISSLNHVKWFGTSLRVERAKQYYLHCLLDEWQQTSVHTETESVSTQHHQGGDGPSKPPFHNMSKGSHVRFSLVDEELPQKPSPAPLDNDLPRRDKTRQTTQMPKNPSAFRSKEHALQTTLSLFGLSAANPRPRNEKRAPADAPVQPTPKRARAPSNGGPNHDDTPGPANPSSHTTSQHITDSHSGKVHPDTAHQPYSIESAKAVEEDPNRIDLQRERNLSLTIYRSMFTDQIAPHTKAQLQNSAKPAEIVSPKAAPFRRAALYTKLQSTNREGLTSSPPKPARDKPVNECVHREDVARDSNVRTRFTALSRRAALYKSLQALGTCQASPTNQQS